MCDMATASLAMSVVGTVMGAVGQAQQAKSQAAMMDYNARIADNNAIAERQRAAAEEKRTRRRHALLRSQAAVGFAKSGVSMEGTPLDLLEENAKEMELDALFVRHSGEVKATAFDSQARADRYQASATRQGGIAGAGLTLLTGLGGIAANQLSLASPSGASSGGFTRPTLQMGAQRAQGQAFLNSYNPNSPPVIFRGF